MADKTRSGEPTFGLPPYVTAQVKSESGMIYAAYHDGDTWYEGHYSESTASGNASGWTAVQIPEEPVSLVESY